MARDEYGALRERLIQTAAQIVEREGYGALSVRKITERAGCAIGMVYKVFDNLDDLALHVNSRTLDSLGQAMDYPLKGGGAKPDVMDLAGRYVRFSAENFHLWSMLFEHRMNRDLPAWFTEKIDFSFRMVEDAILPAAGGDRARARKAAKVLWAGLHGICSLSLTGKLDTVGADSAMILAEDMISNYMEGLEKTNQG